MPLLRKHINPINYDIKYFQDFINKVYSWLYGWHDHMEGLEDLFRIINSYNHLIAPDSYIIITTFQYNIKS